MNKTNTIIINNSLYLNYYNKKFDLIMCDNIHNNNNYNFVMVQDMT